MNDVKAIAREYYVRLDAGRSDLLDLFADDVELYFPKFGIARGKAAFGQLVGGLLTRVATIQHDIDGLSYIVSGNRVAVEGTTSGTLHSGSAWRGGTTPGGRFASIFDIEGGLIRRMFVYLDPDYGGDHRGGFLWPEDGSRTW